MKTWHFEYLVIASILAALNIIMKAPLVEWIGATAVLLTFGHACISDRMAERQALLIKPEVHCFRWSVRYFTGKEILWVLYFLMRRNYSPLVGCFIFILYPFWRRFYRQRFPLAT